MVYIYKKIVAGKPYYYLRISKRKGDKIISKDIAYLGSKIETVKKQIMKLHKYKDEIRKSYRKINLFFETEYYSTKVKKMKIKEDLFLGKKLIEIEACKFHYQDHFKKLDQKTKKEVIKEFATHFSYNTTSLEGNTITLKETQNLIAEGKTPKDRTLREIYDIQNTEALFIKLTENKQEITNNFIINLHKELMKNIDLRIGYRITDNRVIKSHFNSSPGAYVKTDMDLLLKWYGKNKKNLHPIVLATIFHHKFEKIHPFSDGNGRTGRMILNHILIKNNYPPLIIYRKDRTMYLDALGSADKIPLTKTDRSKYKELINFISEEMISSYWNIFL